jgi:RNA polymerase sigma-70 factor, ECF subfamily
MAGSPLPSGGSPPEGSSGPADAELVERVRSGDAEAFGALVGRHMRRAYAIAYRLLGHREDAEDLVQEAFIAALEKLDGFDARRDFAPWFNRIVVNRGLNARKARSVRKTESIPAATRSAAPTPARELERAETRTEVRRAIAALPERQRTIVELFELEGFSGAEIADMLEISPGTVRWHLHEARRALRGTLSSLERNDG